MESQFKSAVLTSVRAPARGQGPHVLPTALQVRRQLLQHAGRHFVVPGPINVPELVGVRQHVKKSRNRPGLEADVLHENERLFLDHELFGVHQPELARAWEGVEHKQCAG